MSAYLLPYCWVFDLKKEDMDKFSYERRAYESVDDWSLSYAISQKLTGKRF